eukprot:1909631-Rhodomonas_salina.1
MSESICCRKLFPPRGPSFMFLRQAQGSVSASGDISQSLQARITSPSQHKQDQALSMNSSMQGASSHTITGHESERASKIKVFQGAAHEISS